MGPTMDMQILRELFGNCIAAAADPRHRRGLRASRLDATRARLAPHQIGKHGQIQEWLEDYDEPEPHHRHVSHLYGLHPGDEITPDGTPELCQGRARSRSNGAATPAPAGPWHGRPTSGPACTTATAPTSC